MDDAAFERWSQALEELRRDRQEQIERNLQAKADSFKPGEFYAIAQRSLETILDRWYAIEEESWQSAPPAAVAKALQTVRSEMDSICEFELNAIERDAAAVMGRITWNPADFETERKNFLAAADETNKKYILKLKSFSPGELKIPLSAEPIRAVQYTGAGVRGGGGILAVVMFVVGLLLGGGTSLYFRDSQQKIELRFQEEKDKLLADQRALADSMALLHSSFADLALGKSQSIPQLQAEMGRLQQVMDEKEKAINSDFARQREFLIKRTAPGDRLDQALEELERERARRIKKYEDDYRPSIRVYEKRILLYKDLLGEPATTRS